MDADDRLRLVEFWVIARIRRHRLKGWTYKLNESVNHFGYCDSKTKEIFLSRHFVLHGEDDDIKDLILHEIAHAIVGCEHGHDQVWKACAAKIGCRNVSSVVGDYEVPEDTKKAKFKAKCRACKTVHYYYRRPKSLTGRYCAKCGPRRGALVYKPVIR